MFGLFSGCFEALLRKEELHVLLIGLDKAGKTTLLERLKTLYTDLPGLEADKVLPTVGLNLAHFQVRARWEHIGGASGRWLTRRFSCSPAACSDSHLHARRRWAFRCCAGMWEALRDCAAFGANTMASAMR
jgi:hypothetical protein